MIDTKKLTEEQMIQYLDEQTLFSLAVLMMDIHTGTVMKNKNMVANAFMKAGVVLRSNPGFPARFKAVQEIIKAQLKPPTASVIDKNPPPPQDEL